MIRIAIMSAQITAVTMVIMTKVKFFVGSGTVKDPGAKSTAKVRFSRGERLEVSKIKIVSDESARVLMALAELMEFEL